MPSIISSLDFLYEIITVRINYAIRMANSWNYIQDTGALSLIKEQKKIGQLRCYRVAFFLFTTSFATVSFYLIILSCFGLFGGFEDQVF